MNEAKLNWYAVRLTSNALQPKIRKIGVNGKRGGRYLFPISRGKMAIEQSVNECGFELFIPWERLQIIHHRSKKKILRDKPLLPGYGFIQCHSNEVWQLFDLDGVSEVMSHVNGTPEPISNTVIYELRKAQFAIYCETMEQARPLTAKRLGKKFQQGVKLKPKSDKIVGKIGEVSAATGRKTVKTTIEMFGQMVPAEISVELVEVA